MAPLSSITSTELLRITFSANYMANWVVSARWAEQWVPIDEELYGLVDRLRAAGYRRALEVELLFTKVGTDARVHDFTKLLPRFREKGVVTVIDAVHGDWALRSSTQNR